MDLFKTIDEIVHPVACIVSKLDMWKMIIGQSIYQLAVTLALDFSGESILGYDGLDKDRLETLVFNTYVWMQFFNQYK
jgi:Ca2+-transporting ATPase